LRESGETKHFEIVSPRHCLFRELAPADHGFFALVGDPSFSATARKEWTDAGY
jgi:hypothetical protein